MKSSTNATDVPESAPPPYSEAAPAYSPPPTAPQTSPSRTLHVHYDSKCNANCTILDTDISTPLYQVETHRLRSPQIAISSATTGQEVGTAKLHGPSSNLECTLGSLSTRCTIKSKGLFKDGCTFPSPMGAKEGATWTWRGDSVSKVNIVCEDEMGMVVAKFETANWDLKKSGRLELMGKVDGRDEVKRMAMEAVLITGMALIEYQRRRSSGCSSAA